MSTFVDLPLEIQQWIFSYLDAKDILTCRETSKIFQNLKLHVNVSIGNEESGFFVSAIIVNSATRTHNLVGCECYDKNVNILTTAVLLRVKTLEVTNGKESESFLEKIRDHCREITEIKSTEVVPTVYPLVMEIIQNNCSSLTKVEIRGFGPEHPVRYEFNGQLLKKAKLLDTLHLIAVEISSLDSFPRSIENLWLLTPTSGRSLIRIIRRHYNRLGHFMVELDEEAGKLSLALLESILKLPLLRMCMLVIESKNLDDLADLMYNRIMPSRQLLHSLQGITVWVDIGGLPKEQDDQDDEPKLNPILNVRQMTELPTTQIPLDLTVGKTEEMIRKDLEELVGNKDVAGPFVVYLAFKINRRILKNYDPGNISESPLLCGLNERKGT